MNPMKRRYITISGDAIIKMLKERGMLPADAECVAVIESSAVMDVSGTIRIIVTADEYSEVLDGGAIPRMSMAI